MSALDYIAPFVGSTFLEVVHWYRIREHVEADKYKRILRSSGYWIITLATALLGGVATLIYFQSRPELSAGELLIAGAAFPTLFKKLVAVFTDKKETTLGVRDEISAVRTYFSAA